jgi:hypothetical protein
MEQPVSGRPPGPGRHRTRPGRGRAMRADRRASGPMGTSFGSSVELGPDRFDSAPMRSLVQGQLEGTYRKIRIGIVNNKQIA